METRTIIHRETYRANVDVDQHQHIHDVIALRFLGNVLGFTAGRPVIVAVIAVRDHFMPGSTARVIARNTSNNSNRNRRRNADAAGLARRIVATLLNLSARSHRRAASAVATDITVAFVTRVVAGVTTTAAARCAIRARIGRPAWQLAAHLGR